MIKIPNWLEKRLTVKDLETAYSKGYAAVCENGRIKGLETEKK